MKTVINLCVIIFISCNSNKKVSKSYIAPDCSQRFDAISFKTIVDSTTKYDGHFVEVIGDYLWSTEESAISMHKFSKPRIWIAMSKAIADSLESTSPNENAFAKLQGKKIKIRGFLNANEHGHLGEYVAVIKDICYLEVFE